MKATHEYFNKWTSWRNELMRKLGGVYRRLDVEIVEEYSCDFPSHSAAKKRDDPSICLAKLGAFFVGRKSLFLRLGKSKSDLPAAANKQPFLFAFEDPPKFLCDA